MTSEERIAKLEAQVARQDDQIARLCRVVIEQGRIADRNFRRLARSRDTLETIADLIGM